MKNITDNIRALSNDDLRWVLGHELDNELCNVYRLENFYPKLVNELRQVMDAQLEYELRHPLINQITDR